MLDLVREAKRLVDASQRAFRPQRLRLKLREQSGVEPEIDPNALLDESRHSPSNLGCASQRVVDPPTRPTAVQFGLVEVLHHLAFSRDAHKSLRRTQRRQR